MSYAGKATTNMDWIACVPEALAPSVSDDLRMAQARVAKSDRVAWTDALGLVVGSRYSPFQGRLAQAAYRRLLLRGALSAFPVGGLPAALAHIMKSIRQPDQRSRAVESLADSLDDHDARLRAYWIAYGSNPTPDRAEQIARKLFRLGNITGSGILLARATSVEDSGSRTIRLCNRLLSRGVDIPPMAMASGRRRTQKARIAYVASSILPLQTAGYTVRTHNLLRALQKAGHGVTCYARPGYPWNSSKLSGLCGSGLQTRSLDAIDYICTPIPEGEPELLIERMSDVLAKHFRSELPDIVHAASNQRNALPALIAARQLGLPFVYEVRGLWELTAAVDKPWWKQTEKFELDRSLEIRVASESDHVFALTQGIADQLIAGGVSADKITLLPNAVDAEQFRLATNSAAKTSTLTVAYAGTLRTYEGLDDLIEASRILRARGVDIRVLIIGDGPARDELVSLTASRSLQGMVTFTGELSQDQMRSYLDMADVVALPRKPFELCKIVSPLKPFEAMAMGKAVVVSDLPALREIVMDLETGRVCRPNDPVNLADVLQELAADPGLRARLGTAAREWVVNYHSWDAMAARIEAAYERLA